MTKHSGGGSHRRTGSGRRHHQKNRRKNGNRSVPAWAREESTVARAIAAVAHSNRLTALLTSKN